MSDDLDGIVDKLVEAQYGKESPVQIANVHERIAELEADQRRLEWLVENELAVMQAATKDERGYCLTENGATCHGPIVTNWREAIDTAGGSDD